MSRNPNAPKKHTGIILVLVLLMLVFIAATAFMIKLCIDLTHMEANPSNSQEFELDHPVQTTAPTTEPTETTMPEPETVVATATISATGDLLMHLPVINTGLQKDGSYNFDSIFQYLKDYSTGTDYAVANLETTLLTNEKKASGYPMFNCPDEIVDGAQDAGFDMLLTANNHSYDTSMNGYIRTQEVITEKGLDKLGTMTSAEDAKYLIKDINGIKVGLICYTYETPDDYPDRPSLNGILMAEGSNELVNSFDPNKPEEFYAELGGYLEEMEAAGAEATVLFVHWGVEYILKQNESQTQIAQGICDLGVDVIIGGHPHVVQPVDLLTSTTDPNHKTVCLYSMGNAVSNQRFGNLKNYISTAHTEDGVFFSVTFEKYSDGEVYLVGAELMPCWVYLRSTSDRHEYNILPLDISKEDQWATLFEIPDYTVASAQKSYERTMAIVGEGLTECQEYLAQAKVDREQYYYDLAYNPEKLAAAAVEVPTQETTVPTETE